MSETDTYIVELPIHPAVADVAGAPAAMIEHYVRCVGRPQGQSAFTIPLYSADALASRDATIAGLRAERDAAFNAGYASRDEVVDACRHRAEVAEARCAELEKAAAPIAAAAKVVSDGEGYVNGITCREVHALARALSASSNREERDA